MSSFKGAAQGYIFYDRLQNGTEFQRYLYDSAARALDGADSIFNDREDPSKYAAKLRQQADYERGKELEFLTQKFGLNLSHGQLDTIARNKEIVSMFNDALNITKLWQRTAQKISALGDYLAENEGDPYAKHKGINVRNLLEERVLYQIDQYYKNNVESFVKDCFSTIMSDSQFEQASIAQDSATINLMVDAELAAKWPNFVDSMINWAFTNLDAEYKRESTSKDAQTDDKELNWNKIAEEIRNNQALIDQFTARYRVVMLERFQSSHREIIQAISENLMRATKNGKARGNPMAKNGIYSKQVRSAAKHLKPKTGQKKKGGKKGSRASKRGEVAELLTVGIVASLEEKLKNDRNIKVSTSLTGDASTIFDTDVASVFYESEIIMPSFKDVLKQVMPGKEENSVAIHSKTDAATAIKNYEQAALALDPNATFVYESVKNYDLGYYFSEHGGFSGTSMSYSSATEVLSNILNKSRDSVNLYLVRLMNTIEGAMYAEDNHNDHVELMTKAMANEVAAFLFDDMYASTAGKGVAANSVHLFRLSDIIVPLSVFLEGMAYAFSNWATDPQQAMRWFRIDYKTSEKIKYPDDSYGSSGKAEHAWGEQRREAWRNFEISTAFFGDFITEVKKYL